MNVSAFLSLEEGAAVLPKRLAQKYIYDLYSTLQSAKYNTKEKKIGLVRRFYFGKQEHDHFFTCIYDVIRVSNAFICR